MIELCDEDRRRLDLLVGIDGMTREDVTALAEIAFARCLFGSVLHYSRVVYSMRKTPEEWAEIVARTCSSETVDHAIDDAMRAEVKRLAETDR